MSTKSPAFEIINAPTALPEPLPTPSIFLSGFISPADDCWREKLSSEFAHLPVTIFNPLRRDWDGSWKERIDEPKFVEQVSWELSALSKADIVLVNFPDAKEIPENKPKEAAITLLELGFIAGKGGKAIIVCCPEGYVKRGNVQILSRITKITVVDTAQGLVSETMKAIKAFGVDGGTKG